MVRIAVAIGGLAAASYFDLFNNKNVPVMIPYAMMGMGLLLNLLSFNADFIIYSIAVAGTVFLLGYFIYRAGQIGGADILLFAAIALLLPLQPAPLLRVVQLTGPYLNYPPVLSVFLISGLLSICSLAIYYLPKIILMGMKGKLKKPKNAEVVSASLLALAYFIAFYFLGSFYSLTPVQGALIFTVLALAFFLILFRSAISRLMVKWVPVRAIDEEDVLAADELGEKFMQKHKLGRLLTPEQIKKLSKIKGMKKFPVLKGLPPFVPYMLAALLLLIAFGDPILLLFS